MKGEDSRPREDLQEDLERNLRAIGIPRDGEEPVFAAPWQARTFALVVSLHRSGCFDWNEWVETLVAEIQASPERPDESPNDAYYRQWQAALETIVARKGLAAPAELQARTEAWRRAYLRTPHGQPVELFTGDP